MHLGLKNTKKLDYRVLFRFAKTALKIYIYYCGLLLLAVVAA